MRRPISLLACFVALGCAGARDPQCPIATPPPPPTVSCAPSAAASSSAAPGPVGIPDLSWLGSAKTVRIERGRGGLTGSWVVHYDLRRRDASFVGTGVLTANRLARKSPSEEGQRQFRSGALELSIPAPAIESLLQALSRTAIRGPVAPGTVRVEASDDYPWWIIDIEEADSCTDGRCMPARSIRLTSPPTGSRPAPWFLWPSERPLEIDPATPASACEALVPLLRDDAFQALIR